MEKLLKTYINYIYHEVKINNIEKVMYFNKSFINKLNNKDYIRGGGGVLKSEDDKVIQELIDKIISKKRGIEEKINFDNVTIKPGISQEFINELSTLVNNCKKIIEYMSLNILTTSEDIYIIKKDMIEILNSIKKYL